MPDSIGTASDNGNSSHYAGSSAKAVKALARGSACIVCRRRKLRCDGIRPSCSTCTRLKHECGYGDPGHEKLAEQITELEAKVRSLEEELAAYRQSAADAAANPVEVSCSSTIPLHPYDYDGHQQEHIPVCSTQQTTMLDSFREAVLNAPIPLQDGNDLLPRPPSPQTQVRRPHSTLQKLQAHLQMRQFHNDDPASADSSRAASPMEGYYEDSSSDAHSFQYTNVDAHELSSSMLAQPLARFSESDQPFNAAMQMHQIEYDAPTESPSASEPGWASGESSYLRHSHWSHSPMEEKVDVHNAAHDQSSPPSDEANYSSYQFETRSFPSSHRRSCSTHSIVFTHTADYSMQSV